MRLLAVALCVLSLQVAANPLVIQNDRGGYIDAYRLRLAEIDRRGREVRILGDCHSACTLYLGAVRVCVSPAARLGFHGPSFHGRPLQPADFERASVVMADHYPAPLRRWFLAFARYELRGVYVLSGVQLIRLGVPAC